ncbi:MAG TPA: 2-C-methyl-D-erythritol 4-phosphate cytidylyltransferase [Intrasporangium sp.]|uniref:2-C-methyl-D-erythritol 4-phosphate cytidylyltransferase n=1 Tax=Intrasporangium sp. TaxID=1925024 RepID=UPI002D779D6A|nr:2-C-methyl-D-erythritol 4-phosphate cytidylyltransferase [Intrasporangium sp.]HET7397621.1 2-C-methyl-D-erythritol 4-phosphate cytidylyltransferase [Intrasporangium sp.]
MSDRATGVVLVAAGSGSRLGGGVPKAFVPLAGRPLLGHALGGALSCPHLLEVVVVAPAGWLDDAQAVVDECRSAATAGEAAYVTVVPGGQDRGESVAAGLAALRPTVEFVLVHDAARCLAPHSLYERVAARVRAGAPAVVPGLPVVDTIKQVDAQGRVVGTLDRPALRAIQTPQGFRRDVLERAHVVSSEATDDAALVERLGEPVLVVPGDLRALKITTPDDLATAARILQP